MENKIREILDERGIGPTAFAREIGVPQTTISTIYSGRTKFEKIRIETFVKIAHGLGMTADELWGKRDVDPSNVMGEGELVRIFRNTDDRGRQAIMAVARSQRGVEGEFQANQMTATV